jgi:hypothetical protein
MDTTEVDYVARRDEPKAPEARGRYRVGEDSWALTAAKSHKGEAIVLRRVFVWSSADATASATARAKKLDRAREDLEALARGLGGRHYPTAEKVSARLAVIAAKRRVGDYLAASVGTDDAAKPTLAWHFDQAAVDHEAATDGWYCLLTNLDPAEADAGEVLVRYKGQEVVERRYGSFKGPLAVAPVFLKNNRRIEALLSVICLAPAHLLPRRAPGPSSHRARADDDGLSWSPQGSSHGPPDLRSAQPACARSRPSDRAAGRPGAAGAARPHSRTARRRPNHHSMTTGGQP